MLWELVRLASVRQLNTMMYVFIEKKKKKKKEIFT